MSIEKSTSQKNLQNKHVTKSIGKKKFNLRKQKPKAKTNYEVTM